MPVQILKRLFTVEEYHRMAQAKILGEDDRVELIEGEIINMTPIGSRHAGTVNRINHLFSRHLRGRAMISVQNPIRLGEHSEPQPDISLLKPKDDFYASSHPGPEDVLLLVEVSETSAEYDREVKLPLYARFGIPEVWLVDLEGKAIEVYRDPSSEGYREVQTLGYNALLSPNLLPDLEIPVRDILG